MLAFTSWVSAGGRRHLAIYERYRFARLGYDVAVSTNENRRESQEMSVISVFPRARRLVAVCFLTLLGGCASGSSGWFGEPQASVNPDVMWQDGAQAIATGEAQVSQGEKRLAQGRKQIQDGEAMIRDGGERASQAKLEYEQAAAIIAGPSKTGQQAKADVLREIGMRWEAANQTIKNGNKLVANGNSSIARGEAEIREGLALMETGSVLMRNAHRSRLGQELLPMPAGT